MYRGVVVFAIAGIVSGCFDAGEVQSPDTSPSDLADIAAGDTTRGPCGGCSGETPVCLEETETCVECLDDGDCDGESPVCDATANVCVACRPDAESEWFPDGDGDGFGDASVSPAVGCERPEGMVANADDCDDTAESVHPEADEVCNERDDDCDERVDEEVVPGECAKQDGVCAGAAIATCSDDAAGYAACGADEYGDGYIASDDEKWHCDGTDNDCDGEVDELCCPEGREPETMGAGEIEDDDLNAAVAAAASGTSADRRFALAWSVGETIHVKYPDATAPKTRDTRGVEVVDLEITSSGSDYLVAATLRTQVNGSPVSRVELHRYNASLVHRDKVATVESRNGGGLSGLSMAVDGNLTWVTYSRETPLEEYDIVVATVDHGARTVANEPTPVTEYRLWDPGAPELAVVDGTPTVAWWNANRQQVRGVRMSGSVVSNRFYSPAGQTDREANESIALVAAGGEAHLVYPYYVGSTTSELTHLSVGPDETDAVGSGTTLTGATERHREPAAVPVDRTGDGESDHLLVVWEAGGDGLQVGRVAFDSPQSVTPRSLYGQGAKSVPDLAVDGRRALAVWNDLLLRTGENHMVYGASISIDGVPVCRESSE